MLNARGREAVKRTVGNDLQAHTEARTDDWMDKVDI